MLKLSATPPCVPSFRGALQMAQLRRRLEGGVVTPVDYKHGKPLEGMDELKVWPADRAQLAVQAIVLRENGYSCDEGVLYYQGTKQRVRVPITEEVITETAAAIRGAWELAENGSIPPPLFGSPKCGGCSLAPICLPDEVNRLLEPEPDDRQLALFAIDGGEAPKKPAGREMGQLLAPRDDLKPAYLDTQGLRVGRSGGVLQVKEKDKTIQEIRLNEINQLNVMGNIQVTTQAVQSLLEEGIPVCYFSQGGWFYGITTGMVIYRSWSRIGFTFTYFSPVDCVSSAST
ncbi:MAG: CRISPR-associated endonuclease Cas1 [Bryobacteraceae bacterium]|nr:CRISPR-associated endonuclease Cas1 [Bryobacteraceae bacterium]